MNLHVIDRSDKEAVGQWQAPLVTGKSEAARVAQYRAWLSDAIERSKALPDGEFAHVVVEVTPLLAEVILDGHNDGNRPLKTRRFRYAQEMKDGKWVLHSQGISFARDGRLNNGQNRLEAVRIAGVPVRMNFAFGETRQAFIVLDTGAARGGSDTLHVAGRKNTAVLATSARLLHGIEIGAPRANLSFSNEQILKTVIDHPDLEAATTPGGRITRYLKIQSSAPTVALYLIATKSKHAEKLNEFVDLLAVGNVAQKRSPILILREALRDKRITTSRGGQAAPISAAIILAWNLWVRGRTASLPQITWRDGASFPMPE